MYLLNSNVFIAFGKQKALIYDLREQFAKLIWLNHSQTLSVKNFLINNHYINQYVATLIDKKFINIDKIKKINFELKNEVDYDLFNFAWIEVTDKCNFSCIHCYGNFNPKNFYELSLEDTDIIIKNLSYLQIQPKK